MIQSKVKTKDGFEQIEAYTVDEAELPKLKFIPQIRNHQRLLIASDYATLDTETSHEGIDRGWVYQWAFKLKDLYIYGRTPSEFMQLLAKLEETYRLDKTRRLLIYVHNLSYDFQYLKSFLIKAYPDMSILATDRHSLIECRCGGLTFRCSYRLTNMPLEMLASDYAEQYRKASGEVDYTKVRYQDSKLSASDWMYQFSDVAAQMDGIRGYYQAQGYNSVTKIPLTSTGFVREDCRQAAKSDPKARQEFELSALTLEQYNLCQQAFMGGVTIASYKYADEIVLDPGHKDFTSSYPYSQLCDPYMPTGKPSWWGEVEDMDEFEYLLNTYCCVFVCTFEQLRLKEGITAPYVPSSKCMHLEEDLKLNGKVVLAAIASIALTEIDYRIIEKQYEFEAIHIDKMLIFKRGKSPDWMRGRVLEYFRRKCALKGGDPRLYAASKALLNGIYGMSATKIVRDEYDIDSDGVIDLEDAKDPQKVIEKYYRSYSSFMSYQIGLYTTAWARHRLINMIEAAGYENFVYCDTDSIFYIKTKEGEKRLRAMNRKIRAAAKKAGAIIGDNVLGLATDEPPIRRFKALHAKCYGMEELGKDGVYHLKVTIAGVPKATTKYDGSTPIRVTSAEELGSLEALEDGFTFRHNGGTRCVYVEDQIRNDSIHGHMTEYASSAIIENIEKRISDTMFSIGADYSILSIRQERSL